MSAIKTIKMRPLLRDPLNTPKPTGRNHNNANNTYAIDRRLYESLPLESEIACIELLLARTQRLLFLGGYPVKNMAQGPEM